MELPGLALPKFKMDERHDSPVRQSPTPDRMGVGGGVGVAENSQRFAEAGFPQFTGGSGGAPDLDCQKDVKRLAMGASTALGGRLVGRVVRLIVDMGLAHILGPASFGLYAIGWTITRIATYITPLGLDAGVIRFGSESWHTDKAKLKGVILHSIAFSAVSGLALGVAFYLLAPWLGARVFHQPGLPQVFRWLAFAFPLLTSLRVVSAATRISQRMKFSVYSEEIGQPVAALLLILVFCLIGWRLEGALAAIVLSCGLALLLAVYYVRQLFPEVVSKHVKPAFARNELLRFSLPTALSVIFGVLLIWVDRLFVGYYCSAAEAGVYYAASQLSIALAAILSGFGGIISPMVANLYHSGRNERLSELFRVSTKWSLYLSIPPFLLMCVMPRQVMGVMFGKSYVMGSAVLPVLAAGQLINAGTGAVSSLLVMSGNQNWIAALTGGFLVINMACELVLVPRWGVLGAAWGTAITVGGLSLLSILVAHSVLKVWPYDRRYWKGVLGAGLAAGALILLRHVLPDVPLLGMAGAGFVSLAVFAGTLLVCGLDAEDHAFMTYVWVRAKSNARA